MELANEFEELEYLDESSWKPSVFRCVQTSPRRYAVMTSPTERFRQDTSTAPFGVYNLDTAHKKTLESSARDSRRFYASAFQSEAPRLAKQLVTEGPDLMYDCKRTKNYSWGTLGDGMANTPQKLSILRSKYRRFAKFLPTEAPDVSYDVDYGAKSSMTTAIQSSARSYSVMRATTPRSPTANLTTTPVELGPGCYDYAYQKDINVSRTMHDRPLSSFSSTSSRFYNDRADPTKRLGSTWRQEHDDKAWQRHAVSISDTAHLRPQYLPSSYKEAKRAVSPKRKPHKKL